ncbi:MAG: tetraacyldisaccharide 4'-kinase [Phycisphaerales bacterium]
MPDPSGPLPAALRPLAPLAERLYTRAITKRNANFDSRSKGSLLFPGGLSVTLDRPVISVGNLSVGGTGKTPAVQLVCRWLIEDGYTPAIAMRGYAAKDGVSDEAELHRAAMPEVLLAVGPNRVERLLELFRSPEGESVDTIVLDDGFQHRRVARQLDSVLIDATQDPFVQRLLPAGWLREPVESLARAHAVVLTHADRAQPSELTRLTGELARRFQHLTIAHAEHAWTGLGVFEGDDRQESLGWLRGRRYALACAIGKPQAFIAQATEAFGPPSATRQLRDHDPLGPKTITALLRLADGMEALVVTEKDWAKLGRRAVDWPCPIVRPMLELRLRNEHEPLRALVLEAAQWRDDSEDSDE